MSGHVLVVDDDDDIREGIVDALRDEGYDVAQAWNGEDALAKLSAMRDTPCVMLLDLMMPLMDGFELMDALEKRETRGPKKGNFPIIVMTAHPDAQPPQARRVLRKPLGLDTILSVVHEFCTPG